MQNKHLELYPNNEKRNINGYPLYPINTWSSIAYLMIVPLLINKDPVTAIASFLLGIISFMWWCWQNSFIRKIDLGLITYLFMWIILNELNITTKYKGIILILCIGFVIVTGPNFILRKIHTISLILTALILLKNKIYIPLILILISIYCKLKINNIGTGLFHIITALAIALYILNII